MSTGTADRVTFNSAAQTALRVLIASYFLAVSLKIIPGTSLGILFEAILPEPYASATAAGLVFIFSFMIMIGLATRVAALLIALMTFFASYVAMVQLGVADELGAFWRDLALIAALLLTYGEANLSGDRRRRRLVHRKIVPRRVDAIMARAALHGTEEALATLRPKNRPRRASLSKVRPDESVVSRPVSRRRGSERIAPLAAPRTLADEDDLENIFA